MFLREKGELNLSL